ncbi:Signal transduction histidine kinase [Paenibacillus sp. UNCCL117]|uniref:sensor histidine kinase n=1 Tax=unclassified Paenibacillus TaxID=185978 RepID=UPI00088EFA47|nr:MULTISPECIES: HAMP domain-containing sensor histidine kinase [unclassified Paenibacillus]SDC12715.1 Signal transduction histidine kinase [Paenibacillus sp. cl123]SFW16878.1 Signal transduction histidine kinase [Paenibacillus sp. UNCCL117]
MANMLRSFRSRMILLFGLSMLFAGLITFVIYKLLQLYYYTTRYENPLTRFRYFIREVGDINFFLIFFIPLSIWFFFLLTERYAAYFRVISGGIHQLANGNFNNQIYIPSQDEFGDIARDINLAGVKLREASERGDVAENSKEQLVLNLAHDLRTPLTSVIGYLDFMLKDEDLTPAQRKRYITVAHAKSLRLQRLIDELFEVARMSYGRLAIEAKPVDLSELLLQLTEELYPVLEKNGLTSRLQVSPLTVRGDGELLARVFENLLSNAAHYGRDGQYIDVRGFADKNEAVVQIINYGEYISSADLPHIFDMFYTGDKARAYHDGSTGLGLFIAKNIVEQHRGSIAVESSRACTRFEVRLPRPVPADAGHA